MIDGFVGVNLNFLSKSLLPDSNLKIFRAVQKVMFSPRVREITQILIFGSQFT